MQRNALISEYYWPRTPRLTPCKFQLLPISKMLLNGVEYALNEQSLNACLLQQISCRGWVTKWVQCPGVSCCIVWNSHTIQGSTYYMKNNLSLIQRPRLKYLIWFFIINFFTLVWSQQSKTTCTPFILPDKLKGLVKVKYVRIHNVWTQAYWVFLAKGVPPLVDLWELRNEIRPRLALSILQSVSQTGRCLSNCNYYIKSNIHLRCYINCSFHS